MICPARCRNKRNVQYNCCVQRINFDLQQLQAFVAVADRQGFRAAAGDMHLSPAALSRRVDRLEQLLGARLFQRTTRDVRLTRVGEAFLSRARAALDDLEAAVLGINEISARHAGRVTVACVPSAANTLMPAAIVAFSKQMPHVRIRVMDEGMNEVAAAVQSGEADFGLGFRAEPDAGLRFEAIRDDPYVLALRRDHPLARKRRLTLADLRNERWLSVARTSRNRQVLDAYFSEAVQPPPPWLEVSHVATLLAMVEAGLGIGMVPSMALDGAHAVLKGVRLADVHPSRGVGLLSLEGTRIKPVAQRFYDQLKTMSVARRHTRTNQGSLPRA
jgi:DNA-binding transcriptional LysR family regulator